MTTPAEWPGQLRELVATHGPAKVWRAGLVALGFPPTWATGGTEFETVRRAMTTV